MRVRQYSDRITCIYDEQESLTNLGHGTHYSIFTSSNYHWSKTKSINEYVTHIFAIIWDADHDIRIIKTIEQLHDANLLWPISFIGEHSNWVTVLYGSKTMGAVEPDNNYEIEISDIIERNEYSEWMYNYNFYQNPGDRPADQLFRTDIVRDCTWRSGAYIQGIDALWQLGPHSQFSVDS
jgi:hypothetical protein